jgi:hypothetical protein
MSARTDYAAMLRQRAAEAADDAASMAPVSVAEWRAIRDRADWRARYAVHGIPRPPERRKAVTRRDRWMVAGLVAGYLIASSWIGATGG